MKKTNYKLEAIDVLKTLAKEYPNQTLGIHIGIAFSEYSDYSWLSDKEFYFALEKYRCQKELDHDIPHSENINDILKDGMNLQIDDEEDGY